MIFLFVSLNDHKICGETFIHTIDRRVFDFSYSFPRMYTKQPVPRTRRKQTVTRMSQKTRSASLTDLEGRNPNFFPEM